MDGPSFDVDLNACRQRQQRLLEQMDQHAWQCVLLTRRESVQWLTGAHMPSPFCPAAAMHLSGKVQLVLPSRKSELTVAADDVLTYEEKWHSTLRDEQRQASNEVLRRALPAKQKQIGGEWSLLGPDLVAAAGGTIHNVEPLMFRLRRRKDPDELRMMQRANEANRAMYLVAREIVQPGVNELTIYNELHATAVRTLGEPLTYFGQDFRANARGGPPRDRRIEAGELYILDLGVGFRGYYSDNARTLVVGGDPTQKQMQAWSKVAEVFSLVEQRVRPGASCRQLFEEVDRSLKPCAPWLFNHHLGHGVGLAPHEAPHLNPCWDDLFEVGDFFTVEPGLYHEELRHGVRLEENYRVTSEGVEKLTDYPLGL